MDVKRIRQDFPLLQEGNGRKPVVYFDSACQSLRPRAVIDAVNEYYLRSSACGGRSMHHLAAEVSRGVDEARLQVARFIGANRKEEIVFTRNTTEGINLVANALEFQPGDVILVSDKEHNSNLIPWQVLARRKGLALKVIPSRFDNTFDLDAFNKLLDGKVRLVALGHISNLDGVTIPAEEAIRLARKAGALVLLDAAQSAPHKKINVKALDVDFLAFSGHKLLGPSGTGVLYAKYAHFEQMQPFMVGGETVASSTYESCEFLPPPEKFEAGLQDYAGIFGLGAAVKYLQGVGFDFIQKHELQLNETISAQIRDIPGLKIIGPADPRLRGGIVSFYIEGLDSHRVALMLDQMAGIEVRSGQHCVHSWFNARKLAGAVRVSGYIYNTLEEAALLAANIQKIRRVL